MAREIGKLSALKVNKVKDKGLYADGGNLYLQVTKTGAKSWIFRYMVDGKAKSMGLGALNAISLADARIKAADCRKQISEGFDPMLVRKDEREKSKLAAARSMTFEQSATAYIAAQESGWKSKKHKQQWSNTLDTYAYPVFGNLPVQDIDIALVMKVIEPIWQTKNETASRVRSRIELVLDWAIVRGYREGDNPAIWRGKLDKLLPSRTKINKVKHHSALPYKEVGKFIKDLQGQVGMAAKALQVLILTATRTSEILNSKWGEFDLKSKAWIIPAERMKAGKEHRIPLSKKALEILKELHKLKVGEYVFSDKKDKPLSNMAMLALLKRMGRSDVTVHGFRSTFRDWVSEQTNYSGEVAESALAHSIGNKVEAAYRRGDLFDKRKPLMEDWASYCSQASK